MANAQHHPATNGRIDGDPEPHMISLLSQPLDPRLVSIRPSADGRVMAYPEGHAVIDQANRIFGYGRWGSEVISPVSYREIKTQNGGTGQVLTIGLYWARVRVRVHGYESHSDVGCGIVTEQSIDAHETAIKAAVTDGTKRALRRWGRQFGNDLYEKADPARLTAERGLADLRAAVFALRAQLGLAEAEVRVQASERSGRPFVEIGVHDLASLVRAMAEALKKSQRAA